MARRLIKTSWEEVLSEVLFGHTAFLPENILTCYDNLEFALRILLASLLGILVGIERTRRLKGAGIRTHCIVAMTAAVFMILSKYAFVDGEAAGIRGADSARIAAQVVSGISFLGAGIIFKQSKNSVHGLTTAAGMWATAAVGMAIGAGMYWVGIIETFALIMMQTLLHRFRSGSDALTEQVLIFRVPVQTEEWDFISRIMKEHGCLVDSTQVTKEGDFQTMIFKVRARNPFSSEDILQITREHPGLRSISVKDV